jgi:hypothetical protein
MHKTFPCAHTHTPYILQKARAHAHTYTPQSSIANTACKVRAPHLRKLSCAAVQKQSICKMSVHGLTCCATIDDSHKAKYAHQHTHTIFRESARTRTHTIFRERERTHTIFRERERTHTMYFTGEETMHKTFLCAHTHHNHQSQIQHAKCVRFTSASPSSITAAFPLQLRRSNAHANVSAWTYFLRSDR